jgi:histidine kinase/DNA gyrase B/HSP90-like ATPase
MITKFEESNLWKVFERKSDTEDQGIIKSILNDSRRLLKQIVRSFPTFTNHDEEHSLKIIENIEMLLGNEINKLSSTEACVLLLSSYWHDLGMICNNSNEITNEVWFQNYCKNKPECNEENLTDSIVSEYLRINHHKRLEKYLYDGDYILEHDRKSIIIDGNDIVKISYEISMSHNYETKDIQTLKDLGSNENTDDFVFCAILLRLADIMDFDNDRTSISTYKFLALDNPSNESEKYSQKEWKKHIDNVGFEYSNNILYFKANPNDPNVEYDIRKFIEIIKYEIEKSDRVFNAHCHKWRDGFKLPSEVDLSGIKPIGYKYGDFKFTFENNQVLDLLTGNNIYTDPMIFIREILQNSIDASLYKERLDEEKGYSDFKCKAIEISDWYDKDGSYWIRFDDFGIGMDEYVLLNYFTKIGKSFYESRDFNSNLGFKAISRFGIGILSCFMVADRLEISTKKENAEAIRVSIQSLHSFFVTQLESEHRDVKPFPSKNENSQKYRNGIGTSIAIKIDFNKVNRWFNIKEELAKHIFYSPIAIK